MADSILVVDIGNTNMTFGIFDSLEDEFPRPTTTFKISSSNPRFDTLRDRLDVSSPWYLASVCHPARDALVDWIRDADAKALVREITHADLPLEINVPHPERVGIDRLVDALGANVQRDQDRPAVVVDTGSAITIDAISSTGSFLGGVIMAGFEMRARALSHETNLLPLISPEVQQAEPELIGRETKDAIRSGIFWGTVGSVREIVMRIKKEIGSDAQVFVTGGDLQRIAGHLPDVTFVPNLVLSGVAIAIREMQQRELKPPTDRRE